MADIHRAAEGRDTQGFEHDVVTVGPRRPTDDALERVAIRAREMAAEGASTSGGAQRARRRRTLRVAGSLAAAAAIVAVVAYALTPRFDDSAFAREQAVAALDPSEGVFHSRAVSTGSGWTEEFGDDQGRRQIWEEWVDFGAERSRFEVREADGKIAELSIQSGDLIRRFAASYEVDAETGETTRLPQHYLIEEPGGEVQSAVAGMIAGLREAIGNGDADVVDIIDDGEASCWVIEWKVPGEDGGDPTYVHATLRTTDYALKSLIIETSGKNGNGRWTGKGEWTWDEWEYVESGSLPEDFFDLDQANKLARPGTKVEKRPAAPQ